jgi:DNA polymerase-3 subunit gamma/tau
MLLKGVDEIRAAPDAAAAAEMLLLRLACVSDLTSPAELARLWQASTAAPEAGPRPWAAPADTASPAWRPSASTATQPALSRPAPLEPSPAPPAGMEPTTIAELVESLRDGGEAPLAAWLFQSAHLIRFDPGQIELRFAEGVPTDVAGRLGEAASRVTGRRWIVVVGSGAGEPTLAAQAAAGKEARLAELAADPELQAVLAAFPGAALVDVRPRRD